MNTKIHRYRQAYYDLSNTVDSAFYEAIQAGKEYQFEDKDDVDKVEEYAETVEYNSSGFYHDHVDIGYVVAIDSCGIDILTKENEVGTIPYSYLNSLLDKITIVEKLTD